MIAAALHRSPRSQTFSWTVGSDPAEGAGSAIVEVLGKQFSPAFGRFLTQATDELEQGVEFVDSGAAPSDGAEDNPSSRESTAGPVRIVVDPALPNGAAELAAGRLQVFDLIDQANRDH